MLLLLALPALGFAVWACTRANQARQGIRNRRGQIRNLWAEIRTMIVRAVLAAAILGALLYAAAKH
jgi:hypothetical protein